ncbi:unnamed protein product [Tuwongella immobilis]|uniref:Uncharacterized protein n=1 Tax=Tuwongella immobilis TaxID=692036 RepID=A0A6C2YU52_9BACT|nr:unnamed protein product [Tuwongella immobilis]VTS06499.1 unnamed protein product [Tuwongella immobilis]
MNQMSASQVQPLSAVDRHLTTSVQPMSGQSVVSSANFTRAENRPIGGHGAVAWIRSQLIVAIAGIMVALQSLENHQKMIPNLDVNHP